MSENSMLKIQQVKELYSETQVNDHLKNGWKLLAVTALTHRHEGGHEEAQTIYILGSEEDPLKEKAPNKYEKLREQLKEIKPKSF